MKARTGFVSNSSSSSFLVVGFYIRPPRQESPDIEEDAEWWKRERSWDIWMEERRQAVESITRKLRENTGVHEIRVIDPYAEPEEDGELVVGYSLGGEEWHIDREELDSAIEVMAGLRCEFAHPGKLSIISGEEPL